MIMKLFKKLCQMFGKCEDPEIIDDMYITNRSNAERLDMFHAELGLITESKGICYFDALVEHINNARVDVTDRSAIEHYLYHAGLGEADVKQLTDEFFKIAGTGSDL